MKLTVTAAGVQVEIADSPEMQQAVIDMIAKSLNSKEGPYQYRCVKAFERGQPVVADGLDKLLAEAAKEGWLFDAFISGDNVLILSKPAVATP